MENLPRVGPYLVLRKLGQGGMGAVYVARHERLDRTVALKILTVPEDDRSHASARFKREAECAMALSHPGLVKVYDHGADAGRQYIAMELVEGTNLAEVLSSGGALPPPRAAKIAREILEALQVCHDAGLLHRDLKPANVMLDAAGRARILDLGLVKPLDRTVLTETGSQVGTPRYMPPEMLAGTEVDRRSDLYQVGLILHECLAGAPAFAAGSLQALVKIIMTGARSPLNEATAGGLTDVVDRLCALHAGDRYQSCAEALEALTALRRRSKPRVVSTPPQPAAIAASPPPTTPSLPSGLSPRARGAVLAGSIALALAAALALRPRAGPPPAPPSITSPPAPSRVPVDDLRVDVTPTRARIRWRTAEPVVGEVRVPERGAVVRETGPTREHEALVAGLEPGRALALEVAAAGGEVVERRTLAPPSVGAAAARLRAALEALKPAELIGELKREIVRKVSASAQSEARARWRKRLADAFAAPDVAAALEGYRDVVDRLAGDPTVTMEDREKIVYQMSTVGDLFAMAELGLNVPPPFAYAAVAPPGIRVEKALPSGLAPIWGLRFGDGGLAARRPLLALPVPWIEVEGSAMFNSEANAFFGAPSGRDARKAYERPGMAPERPLARAYLGFRIAGGVRTERLRIACDDLAKKVYCTLAVVRGDAQRPVQEGYLEVDPRGLAGPGALFRVMFGNRDSVLGGGGITLDHLVLYGAAR